MASSIQIIRTIQANIQAGLSALQTPGMVITGWPTANQLSSVLGAGSAYVSLFPQRASLDTKFRPIPGYLQSPPAATLVASVAAASGSRWTITLSGTNAPGLNIHTVVGPTGSGRLDTLYQTTGSETLAQLATTIAARVNTLAIPGVSASASGVVVSITGAFPVQCNVGAPISANPSTGFPTLVTEIGRFTRDILVTVWSPQPDVFTNPNTGAANNDSNRETVEAAVLLSIGGSDNLYVLAPDGSAFRAEWRSTGDWNDDAQSSYSAYKSAQYLTINYPLFRPIAGAPIGAVNFTQQVGSQPATTQVIG